jgi:hypothetical protein
MKIVESQEMYFEVGQPAAQRMMQKMRETMYTTFAQA